MILAHPPTADGGTGSIAGRSFPSLRAYPIGLPEIADPGIRLSGKYFNENCLGYHAKLT